MVHASRRPPAYTASLGPRVIRKVNKNGEVPAMRVWTAYVLIAAVVMTASTVPTVMPAITEPDEPEAVTLHVKSGSELVVDFATPVSDGGSQITSFKVEWDTNPGTREVQEITTSVFTGPNEIQLVRTTATAIDEVQVVRTSAPDVDEIQTITTVADNEELLGGSFTVTFDTTAYGGGPHTSGPITHDALAATGTGPARTTMEEILEAMPNINDVDVRREGPDLQGGYTWFVTFLSEEKDLPQMSLGSNALTGTGSDVQFTTVTEGNEISGSFTLDFDGAVTVALPWDASEDEMQEALESLPAVDTVEVVQTDETLQGGFVWLITFTSDVNHGSLPVLTPNGAGLTGHNATIEVCSKGSSAGDCQGRSVEGNEIGGTFDLVGGRVDEVQTVTVSASASVTGGSYRLQYSGAPTDPILFSDGSATIEAELLAVVGDPVSVVKADNGNGVGLFTLTITFNGPTGSNVGGGDYAELVALWDGAGCTGCAAFNPVDATMAVATTVGGVLGEAAVGIPYSASVLDITTRLEFLNPIQGVDVQRSGPDAQRGYEWTITFTDVLGDVPALIPVSDSLSGLGVLTSVDEVHKGTVQEIQVVDVVAGSQASGNFTLSFRGLESELIQVGPTCGQSGDIEAILERLTNIGDLDVSCASNGNFGIAWTITFLTNAGDLPDLALENDAGMSPGDVNVVVTEARAGTSLVLGGKFAMEFNGQRTGYVPYNVTAEGMKNALQALSTIGTVDVARLDEDENRGFTWTITFETDLGDNPPIFVDDVTLTGTFARGSTSEGVKGVGPPFNSGTGGLSLGSFTITDLEALSYTITDLKQGVPYYSRVAATNAIGFSPAKLATPPVASPFPRT